MFEVPRSLWRQHYIGGIIAVAMRCGKWNVICLLNCIFHAEVNKHRMYYRAIFVLSATNTCARKTFICPCSCLFMIPPEFKDIRGAVFSVCKQQWHLSWAAWPARTRALLWRFIFPYHTGYFPTFCDKRSTISSGPRALINNVEETVNRESFRDKLYFVRCPHSPGVMRYAQVGVTGNIVHSSARSLSQDTALTHVSMFPFRSQYK